MEYDELGKEENTDPKTTEPEKDPAFFIEDPLERQKKMIERIKLKNKLLRYKERFPHLLGDNIVKIQELDSMSDEELEFLLEEISLIVGSRNSSNLTKMLYFESVSFVERASPMVGMDLSGLKEALQSNAAIHDVLDEMALKYENESYLPPEVRLGYLTLGSILTLSKTNSNKKVINDVLDKKIDSKLKEEFSDL